MPTSEPLHVAFVWHMHQPYYRSARTRAFEMPWARMHALKDYLDMVEILSAYPALHQTFNLVPSLVEQLGDYASGGFSDVYWEHTLRPATDLDPGERVFVVERMCERSDHPRARSHPRYLELALKRDTKAPAGWKACAESFTTDELRDLQVWFNLAWFDHRALASDPLRELVARERGFREEDKQVLGEVQADILARTLPAYRDAAGRGQVELSTSPYFHPILPLLCDSDSARIASPDAPLPPRRFAHPEDAALHLRTAIEKHEDIFGEPPRGVWCSEQAVGENVIPLLLEMGLSWTISDEGVLARSLSGATAPVIESPHLGLPAGSPHFPYRLVRDTGEIAIVFRDHNLSDLIGFAYQAWDSREAAADLLGRLRGLRDALTSPQGTPTTASLPDIGACAGTAGETSLPLVTIALDGENAWEYYPRDGRDFLQYLYEGLSSDDSLRCVTISEHLGESPPVRSLGWLHTGSWIGADLRTWCGTQAQNTAWEMLHQARDAAARRRGSTAAGVPTPLLRPTEPEDKVATAWHHVLAAEGSDWFWWFGDHHHTELDPVWDLNFRLHLQEVYRCLGEPVPPELLLPLVDQPCSPRPVLPTGALAPTIDGTVTEPAEWEPAGSLTPDLSATMQRSEMTKIEDVRFGWHGNCLCILVVPGPSSILQGLELEIRVARSGADDDPVLHATVEEEGKVAISCGPCMTDSGATQAAWKDVIEMLIPLSPSMPPDTGPMGLVLRIGRDGMNDYVFRSADLASLGGPQ